MSIKSLFSSRQHARRQARTRRNGRRFQDIIDKAFVSAKVQKADADALARTQSEAINITNAIWLTEDALRKLHKDLNAIPDENHDTVDLDPDLDIDRFEFKGLPTLKLKSWRKLPEQVKCRIWCGCVWAANGFKLNDAWTKAEKSLVNTIGKLVIVRKVCDSKRFERIGGCVVRQLNGRGKDDTYLCLKKFFSMILSICEKVKRT